MPRRKQIKLEWLQPLTVAEVDAALDQWREEDDGAPDYPTFGEVFCQMYGVTPEQRAHRERTKVIIEQ